MCTLVAKSGDPWYYVMDKDKGKDDSSKMKKGGGHGRHSKDERRRERGQDNRVRIALRFMQR